MKQVIMRNQFSIFGGFNFPPTPPITLALMNLFADEQMMPAVVPAPDTLGQVQIKIRLSKNETLQVLFANDRVDLTETYHMDETNSGAFRDLSLRLLGRLDSYHVQLNRVARVKEVLLLSPTEDEYHSFAAKLIPFASPSAIEWNTRWVEFDKNNAGEPLSVASEISRVSGFHTSTTGQVESFHAIKLMGDVSTAAENTAPRFPFTDLAAMYDQLEAKQTVLLEHLIAFGARDV